MTDHSSLPPVTVEPERIADYVSSALGIALPQGSAEGLTTNFRLLLSHWAIFGAPEGETE